MKKITLDIKKGMGAVSGAVQKTADMGKIVAIGVQSGVKEFSDQTKQEAYERKLKKYNPLFPEKYHSEQFNLPNLIMIVDDAERRGIDVCEGSLGWLDKKNDMEILCLYDEAVPFSGLQFVPAATCDSVYYVDSFNRKQFVRLDCLFSKAHEAKIAELQHIAYCLGAKNCTVQIKESDHQKSDSKRKFISKDNLNIKGVKASAELHAEAQTSYQNSVERRGSSYMAFEGTQEVKQPVLKWFLHDENIRRLIEMRSNGDNAVKTMTLELEGSASATMSQKTASAIDGAVSKIGAKSDLRMENQATKENYSKLVFHIEF